MDYSTRLQSSWRRRSLETCVDVAHPAREERANVASFLSLPLEIRHRMYAESFVGPGELLDLNHFVDRDEPRRVRHRGEEEEEESEELPSPAGLLRASRAVHDEVERILYAQNFFAVALNAPGGLDPLEALSDVALRELSFLVVLLRTCACCTVSSGVAGVAGSGCTEARPAEDKPVCSTWKHPGLLPPGHQRPLGLDTDLDRATLSQWRRICSRLAAHVRPNQLVLYLECYVEEAAAARMVVEPLRQLPRLHDAGICFTNGSLMGGDNNIGKYIREDLSSIARATVHKLLESPSFAAQDRGFRFLDLPPELQAQILGHTELVYPWPVQWTPGPGKYEFRLPSWGDWSSSNGDYRGSPRVVNREPFCSRCWSVYRPDCLCQFSPSTYFLVSRAFAQVARYVFYSRNTFLVFSWKGYSPPYEPLASADTGDGEFAISTFLHHLRPDDLRHLSELLLAFPPITPTYLLPEQKAWAAWVEAVDLLSRADVAGLRLEIHFSEVGYFGEAWKQERRQRDASKEHAMFAAYRRILAPLARVPALRSLFVYTVWPMCYRSSEEAGRQVSKDRRASQKALERMIMGLQYDSDLLKKPRLSAISNSHSDYC